MIYLGLYLLIGAVIGGIIYEINKKYITSDPVIECIFGAFIWPLVLPIWIGIKIGNKLK